MVEIPKLEHKPDAAFDIPQCELPLEYRELFEAAKAVTPYLRASDDEEDHPIAERLKKAAYSIEKSLAHAEKYFALKTQRDAAIKRFRQALDALQTVTTI